MSLPTHLAVGSVDRMSSAANGLAILPRMTTRTRLRLTALAAHVVGLLLVSVPAFAAEGGSTKYKLPESTHDAVGVFIIAIGIIGLLFGLDNARRQLKGERDQTDGKWRYR